MKLSKLFLLCVLCFISCKTDKKKDNLNEETSYDFSKTNLIYHIAALSSNEFEGRETGTEGAKKAKEYIIKAFQQLNVEPLGETFEQVFPMPETSNIAQGENILGVVKGTTEPNTYIVISAHYDHLGIRNGQIYNGADDDASGVSALFAFAEYFQKYPPKYSVIFAAFDAEEKGLVGSYYFVDNPIIKKEQIKLNINMDMISRSKKKELYAVGPQHYPSYKSLVETTKAHGNVILKIGHEEWTTASDHAAFHKANIPFIYFGVEDHKDYHRPTDDFENIHLDFYVNSVQTIINFFKKVEETSL
ncbi:peptidase M28-like protein [Kordia periserrulae]|uniref:Peptidase M28-like protein n=1 Tax=Kordia periserrulae TaxID=701523 RepID=A0A2T6C6S8_9FLAO|nr:M28 family peptidase [Kordia periserrulae]PTX63985.1 peptidase M28-like protein [Kordia periserrulae]